MDELQRHRDTINEIDHQLVDLLSRRAEAAQAIGRAKAGSGGAIFVPHRERDVFARVLDANPGPLPDRALRAIWREIMSASIALEQPITVCHFGQAGAFTHLAAEMKFGDSVNYLAVDSIKRVFADVENGRADYGVVPIENSTDGSIADTVDSFLESNLIIVCEVRLRIRHHLMATCARDAIRRVYSRNTVFGQCRRWLDDNLPQAERIELVSTTKAAERAVHEDNAAAIGNDRAASLFGLEILDSDIQDDPHNSTRFVVIGNADKAARPSGDDQTSLMFAVKHRPGALFGALEPFRDAGVNITRIESRPSRRAQWEYLFFCDVLGHREDRDLARVIAEAEHHTMHLRVLGSYPRVDRPLNG